MIKREICGELERCAGLLPVVTLLGPRQSGKTTIVRHVFHGYSYANLEDTQVFELARTDSRRAEGDGIISSSARTSPRASSP